MLCSEACQGIQELFPEFLSGDLDRVEAHRVEEHLTACRACCEEMVIIRGLVTQLSAIPEDEPPADFSRMVMERLDREPTSLPLLERLASWFQPSFLRVAVPAVAAGVAMAALMTFRTAAVDPLPEKDAPAQVASRPAFMRPLWVGGALVVNDQYYGPTQSGQIAVEKGDSVKTPETVRATMIYQGRSTVELAENTMLVLKGDGIFLGEGRIAAAIHGLPAGSFRVETPHARIAHLGTEFTVDVAKAGTRIEVSSGRVTVSKDKSEDRILSPGQFAVVSPTGEIRTGVTGVTEAAPVSTPHEVPENVDIRFDSR